MQLPPIDAHAHIEPSILPADLAALDALVFAVTMHPREWKQALARDDALTVWGLGVHPASAESLRAFDADQFGEHLEQALLVGEVGLDARAGRLSHQKAVLGAVLDAVGKVPRPITLHSVGTSRGVLDALTRRPVAAPILHWWRGSRVETEQAIEMGCYFSLNGAEAVRPKVLELLPPDRVLTETDFPHTFRADRRAARPAAVETIERALENAWSVDRFQLRRQLWRTVGGIFDRCDLVDRAPGRIQDVLLTVGTH